MSLLRTNCCGTLPNCGSCCVVYSGEANVSAIKEISMEASRNFSWDIQPCSMGQMAVNNVTFDSCWFALPRSQGSSGGYDYDPAFVNSNCSAPTTWVNFNGGCEGSGAYPCSGVQPSNCCTNSGSCFVVGQQTFCNDGCAQTGCGSAGVFSGYAVGVCPNITICPPTRPNTCYTTSAVCCTDNPCQATPACCDDGNWQLPISSPFTLTTQVCGFGVYPMAYSGCSNYCKKTPCNSQYCTGTFVEMTGHSFTNNNPRITRTNGTLQPITETLQTVATFSRNQTAEDVDYAKQINLIVYDTLAPTQYATPQYPIAYAPPTSEEMAVFNMVCAYRSQSVTNSCTTGTTCQEDISECVKCGVATATLIIRERGATQPAFVPNGQWGISNLVVGTYYEIVTVGNMKWKCYGWLPQGANTCANSSPAVGDIFLATACSNSGGCATQGYCNCASQATFPVYTGTCLPVLQHTFEVKGRGHTQDLLQRFIDNFASGLWHYTWDTTGSTYRGTAITGYTSTKPYADDWIGGSKINSDCCNEPAWRTPSIPAWEQGGCEGCVNGLYYHEKQIVDLKNLNFKSIPDVYVRLWSDYCETHHCFSTTFYFNALDFDPCYCTSPPCPYQVFPASSVTACYDNRNDFGGNRSGGISYYTDWKAVKKNTDALSYAGDWAINSTQGRAYNCSCSNPPAPCQGTPSYNIYFLSE